jgi:hypothetical protein
MSDEPFEGAFAMLDVLGFRARLTQGRPLVEVRESVIGAIVSAVSDARTVVDHERRHSAYRAKIGVACFSDTTILWLPTERAKPEIALMSMIYACQIVIAEAMWMNVPLRGAIAYGECIVSSDPVYYLGPPILEAYALEQRQEWAGAVVCESARRLVGEATGRCVEWRVPVKDAEDGATLMAVDWPATSLSPSAKTLDNATDLSIDGPTPDWASCFPGDDAKVVRMREATARFFEERDRVGAAGGARSGPDVRDRRSFWRKRWDEYQAPE